MIEDFVVVELGADRANAAPPPSPSNQLVFPQNCPKTILLSLNMRLKTAE